MLQTLLNLGRVVVHTSVLYVFLIIGFRLLGRRQTSELTATELVVVMVIGSAVETALIAGDTSLQAGLVSAGTLMVANHLFSLLLRRRPSLRHLLMGRPTPLVYRGKVLHRRLREVGLTEDEVLEGMRLRGHDRVEDVRLAMLEIDGSVSVIAEKKDTEKKDAEKKDAEKEDAEEKDTEKKGGDGKEGGGS